MSAAASPTRLVYQLRDEQCRLWKLGKRHPAEEYFKAHPGLLSDPERALVLIYQEVLLRGREGEQPIFKKRSIMAIGVRLSRPGHGFARPAGVRGG